MDKEQIKLYWLAKLGENFGDVLGYELISRMVKDQNIEVIKTGNCDLFSMGSLLHLIPRNYTKYIWGTGSIDGNKLSFQYAKIKAVRGVLTRNLLQLDEDVALGDPAILVPLFFGIKSLKKYKLGVIPHYVDQGHPMLKSLKADPQVNMIDVFLPVPKFIDEVSKCDFIISSSLHGLIVAEAMGIESGWIKVTDKVIGKGYKFKDYYSAFGITGVEPLNFLGNETVDQVIIKIRDRDFMQKTINANIGKLQKGLIKSFPYGEF